MRASRRAAGFTLLELMVVLAIVGITAAIAVPSLVEYQENARLKGAARGFADAFQLARSQALATGNDHMVILSAGGGGPCGNPVTDAQGNPVDAVVIDDGPPGASNCCIDPGETVQTVPQRDGVNFGVANAGAPVGSDTGGGNFAASGTSFSNPAGGQTFWVRFRPDGVPVGVNAGCAAGDVGTGGGGVYVTNGELDFAVVLAPLGSAKVHGWVGGATPWTD